MGIFMHRFYFEQGLPKVKSVQEQFTQITGLKLNYTAEIYLKKIVDNREDIIYHINRSEDEWSFAKTKKFEGEKSKIEGKPVIEEAFFSCEGFDSIYIGEGTVQEKSFGTEFNGRCKDFYFFDAFNKTMNELGGRTFNYNTYPYPKDLEVEKYLEPYHPHEREWKRIKKWAEMSEFEKDVFRNRFPGLS